MTPEKIILLDLTNEYLETYPSCRKAKVSIVTVYPKNTFDTEPNKWTPADDGTDKLFFLGGCNVPRFKVREKWSVTIQLENATAIFINPEKLSQVNEVKVLQLTSATAARITKYLQNYIQPEIPELVLSLMNSFGTEYVYVTQEFRCKTQWSSKYFTSGISAGTNQAGLGYTHEEFLQFKKDTILLEKKAIIFHQNDILNKINSEKITIDQQKYEELNAFGNTGQDENIILMMEIMANSNYETSLLNLLLLLTKHKTKIKYAKTVDHVNFKSLLNFIGITRGQLDYLNLFKVTTLLKEKKQFTRKNAQIIAKFFANDTYYMNAANNPCWTNGYVIDESKEDFLDP
jgi:hypothetical protein